MGVYTDSNYTFYSFLREPNGEFATFGGPGQCDTNGSQGCYGSELTNINFLGLSVGNYVDASANLVGHGLIRNPDGTVTTFDVPGAGTGQNQGTLCPFCSAGLNQWGAIAGTYIDANSVQHGFVRGPDGKFTSFDAPGAGTAMFQGTGCPSDCSTSINDFGAILGTYIDANNVLHGYLRHPKGNIVTVDPAGSTLTWSTDLNDFDAITGYYTDASGVWHSFLAVPCNQGCSEDDGAATRVSPATTANRANPPFNRALNPKPRLTPWNRSVGVQPSK